MPVFQSLSQLVRPGDSLRITLERSDTHLDIRIVPALKGVDPDDPDAIHRQLAAVLAKPVSIRVPHGLDADAAIAGFLAGNEAEARTDAAHAATEYAEAIRDAANAAKNAAKAKSAATTSTKPSTDAKAPAKSAGKGKTSPSPAVTSGSAAADAGDEATDAGTPVAASESVPSAAPPEPGPGATPAPITANDLFGLTGATP